MQNSSFLSVLVHFFFFFGKFGDFFGKVPFSRLFSYLFQYGIISVFKNAYHDL